MEAQMLELPRESDVMRSAISTVVPRRVDLLEHLNEQHRDIIIDIAGWFVGNQQIGTP